MIQEEIAHCAEICPVAHDEANFVSTRVIDSIDPQTPRLVISALQNQRIDQDGRDIEYAALSYSWGTPSDGLSMLRTTKSTLESMIDGVVIVEMPSVFQDAISVCQKLSIRYIWIDALCIVQDDKIEWEQEAS